MYAYLRCGSLRARLSLMLFVIAFTSLPFAMQPARTKQSASAAASELGYDPRFDLNDLRDGIIDYRDLFLFMERFGTQGNPYPNVAPVITINLPYLSTGAKPLIMQRIPAGSFLMGRSSGEQDSYSNEDPQHQVNIGSPFYLGKYEITQAQWQAVMGTAPWIGWSGVVLNDPDSPAVVISWDDAQSFIAALNALGQGTFRLPSEAEWEYACRATTTTRFYWGDDPSYSQIGNYAWYKGNTYDVGEDYAHVVGQKLPNRWGLYDMSGNASEWCEDDWHDSYSGAGRPDNGGTWVDSPRGVDRVHRGGWFRHEYSVRFCRSANRGWNIPNGHSRFDGFRIVRTP